VRERIERDIFFLIQNNRSLTAGSPARIVARLKDFFTSSNSSMKER
jgi:hypothetical protein